MWNWIFFKIEFNNIFFFKLIIFTYQQMDPYFLIIFKTCWTGKSMACNEYIFVLFISIIAGTKHYHHKTAVL